MPNGLEITKAAIDDFKKIQRYMAIAKEENASKTYAELKREYASLKAILQVAGVNMTDIDEIKE
jgi:2-keto-3-deoxy-L-rhamnonate aldolase RhmA